MPKLLITQLARKVSRTPILLSRHKVQEASAKASAHKVSVVMMHSKVVKRKLEKVPCRVHHKFDNLEEHFQQKTRVSIILWEFIPK